MRQASLKQVFPALINLSPWRSWRLCVRKFLHGALSEAGVRQKKYSHAKALGTQRTNPGLQPVRKLIPKGMRQTFLKAGLPCFQKGFSLVVLDALA